MSHRYAIDSFAIRDGRCFGWGWFLDDAQPAVQCELRLPLADGAEQALACVPGGMRPDLRDAFPGVGHAASAGFLVQGKLQGRLARRASATLVATLEDGTLRYGEVPVDALFADGARDGRLARTAAMLWRAPARLREEGASALASRLVLRLRAAIARLSGSARTAMAFRRLYRRGDRVALVFDHAMGGGANKFRRALVDRIAPAGPVLVVVPVLHSLQYQATLHMDGRSHERIVDRLEPLLRQLGALPRLDIHVNELASFESPLDAIAWCVARRGGEGCTLAFYLHDYHAACPAWNLVSVEGTFCGIPALDACRRCLPANTANTLGFSAGIGIPEWREAWGGFLDACDRIVAFSRASVALLERAHPRLRDDPRISIEPHAVDASALRPVRAVPGPPLVVAVAGHISAPKGARMLREMAAIIRRDALPMRIVVFGTLEHHDAADGIEVHGQYAPRELPGLLEAQGAGICLLPSVCAETFSFVTAEYMAMGMPVAVFPIGAPAERVASYDKGLVISQIDAATAVAEIAGFAARMLPRAPQPATP